MFLSDSMSTTDVEYEINQNIKVAYLVYFVRESLEHAVFVGTGIAINHNLMIWISYITDDPRQQLQQDPSGAGGHPLIYLTGTLVRLPQLQILEISDRERGSTNSGG